LALNAQPLLAVATSKIEEKQREDNKMGFLLAIIAVILIVIGGGNHSSTPTKSQQAEPVAVVAPPTVTQPPPQTMPEITGNDPLHAEELESQYAAVEVDDLEQKTPIGPNPCVGEDGAMVPDCAVITRRTGDYELAKQSRVINDWVHVWTR
jgi:hypothetical protein